MSSSRAGLKAGVCADDGRLHAGHVSLMELGPGAARRCVSIFVNPTQFGPREDFSNYPRPIEADLEKCEAAGVDLVFIRRRRRCIGPGSPETVIDLPQLTSVLEGKHRPGHFRGVCQVVAKLFNIVQPQVACFGQKDFQQLRVLSAMTAALDWPIEIVACPTMRDPDGMAMSSRNQYLSAAERQRGVGDQQSAVRRQDLVKGGVRQASRLMTMAQHLLLGAAFIDRLHRGGRSLDAEASVN